MISIKSMKKVAQHATDSVGRVTTKITEAMPSGDSVKQGIAQALILGGKTLIDPKAVVGEFALEYGKKLQSGEAKDAWLALEASDGGLVVLARGTEQQARAEMDAANSDGRQVIICKVMDASKAM
jgi:hypothetical protein